MAPQTIAFLIVILIILLLVVCAFSCGDGDKKKGCDKKKCDSERLHTEQMRQTLSQRQAKTFQRSQGYELLERRRETQNDDLVEDIFLKDVQRSD